MSSKLEFDSIQFSYGDHALLNSIYMLVESGTVTGLLGRNGSGKTTLMKIVFGAIGHGQKSVRINNISLGLSYLPERRIAYLPQGNLIPPYLTVREAFSLFDVDVREATDAFPETIDMMDLRPGALSGGYQRILEIMLILQSRATFCLLDEPFSGLMPANIEKIKSILLKKKDHKGILISDHLHRHVLDISDRLYVLRAGQTYVVREHEDLVSLGYLNHL